MLCLVLSVFGIEGCGPREPQKASSLLPFMFSVDPTTWESSDLNGAAQIVLPLENEMPPQVIDYWNAAYPSYRWHQIMMRAGLNHNGHKNGGRMAILHLAIYDALAASQNADQRSTVADNPELGRSASEFAALLRRSNYKAHTVFYEPTKKGIFVVRIMGQVRDFKRHL